MPEGPSSTEIAMHRKHVIALGSTFGYKRPANLPTCQPANPINEHRHTVATGEKGRLVATRPRETSQISAQ